MHNMLYNWDDKYWIYYHPFYFYLSYMSHEIIYNHELFYLIYYQILTYVCLATDEFDNNVDCDIELF